MIVLLEEHASGADNMDRDSALFEDFLASPAEPILRLYGWGSPTLSIGRFQEAEELQLSGPTLPIVKRPTGGRAVLHTPDELTYLVIGGKACGFPSQLRAIYHEISTVLIRAIAGLGLEARIGGSPQLRGDPICFSRGTHADLMVDDWKVAGSAQRREKDCFMQHGSVLLRFDAALHEAVIGPAARSIKARGLSELSPIADRESLTGAIIREARAAWD